MLNRLHGACCLTAQPQPATSAPPLWPTCTHPLLLLPGACALLPQIAGVAIIALSITAYMALQWWLARARQLQAAAAQQRQQDEEQGEEAE